MTLLSLFLGFGKRRAELALLAQGAGSHRKVLDGYTLPLLDQYIMIVSGTTIVAYSLYTFSAPNVPDKSQHDADHSIRGLHHLPLSISHRSQTCRRRAGRNIVIRPSVSNRDDPLGSRRPGYLLPLVKASAPGKIILFGEHAVVYNRPALAVPVTQVHVDVEVLDSPREGIWINAPGIDLHAELSSLPADHPIGSVILKFFNSSAFPSPLSRGVG